jgi:hypothetical protein
MLNLAINCVSLSSLCEFPMQPVPHELKAAHPHTSEDTIDYAMRVFEDPLVAIRWLNTSNIEFNGETPAKMLFSAKGEKKVLETLKRIDENVYH